MSEDRIEEENDDTAVMDLETRRNLLLMLAASPDRFEIVRKAWDEDRDPPGEPSFLAHVLHAIAMELVAASLRIEEELPQLAAVDKAWGGLVAGMVFGEADNEPEPDAPIEVKFAAAARRQGAAVLAACGIGPLTGPDVVAP